MSAVRGNPFYTHYFSQEMEVATFMSAKRRVIVTQIRERATNKAIGEYISLDWEQAKRFHVRAIEKLVNHGAIFHQPVSKEV